MKRFFLFTFFLTFIIKTLESTYLFGHGDALYYHLPFSVFLNYFGWHETHIKLCGALQSGIIEYLYYIPLIIFGSENFTFQQVSQLIHFSLSIGIGSIVIFNYFKKSSVALGALAGLTLLTLNKSADFFLYAKNDGVIPLLILCSIILIEKTSKHKDLSLTFQDFILSLLLFFPILIKINAVVPLLILDLYIVYIFRFDIKRLIIYAVPQVFSLFIVLFKNWYFLKAPFFPALLNRFPGEVSQSMIDTYTFFISNPPTLESTLLIIQLFFTGKILFLSIPLLVFFNVKKGHWSNNIYFILSASMLVLYTYINGGIPMERFFFYCFFVNVFFIFKTLENFELSKTYLYLILIVILSDSLLDKSILRIKDTFLLKGKTYEEKLLGMSSRNKIWTDLKKIKPGPYKIISDEYQELLYAPLGTTIDCTECNLAGFALDRCSANDFGQIKKSYDFAILAKNNKNLCYFEIRKNTKLISKVDKYEIYRFR